MHLLTSFCMHWERLRLPWRCVPPLFSARFAFPSACILRYSGLVHHATIATWQALLLPTYGGGTYVHRTHILMILHGCQQNR